MPDQIKTPLHPKKPLPVGTKVRYHGSHPGYHGEYTITAVADADKLRSVGRDPETNYSIDRVGYELTPVGVTADFLRWTEMLYFVRRSSITPINEDETPLGYDAEDIKMARECLEDAEFVYVSGTENLPKFKAMIDMAETLLTREADNGV